MLIDCIDPPRPVGNGGQQRREDLVQHIPQRIDGKLAIVMVVLETIEIAAFVESMQAEDDANCAEEVAAGNGGNEDKEKKEDDRSAGVCPAEYVAYLLHGVDDCVYHAQHQLDYLLHLEYLLKQAWQLLLYLKLLLMH